MLLKPRMVGRTDIGKVRKNNEDAFFLDKDHGLMIVADGMGGHQGGEVASRIIVEALPVHLSREISNGDFSVADAKNALGNGIQVISGLIRDKADRHSELNGMGSTVVAALFVKNDLIVAHSGDSRAYLFRSGLLECLTRDHNIAGMMYDAGMLNTEERRSHPGRFALSQYSGMQEEIYPDLTVMPTRSRDRILLCSDGLTEMVPDTLIAQTLHGERIDAVCRDLIELANKSGGRDNITVAIAEVPATVSLSSTRKI